MMMTALRGRHMKYEPRAPEWWTKNQRQEREAAAQAKDDARALKQARRARFVATARSVAKAVTAEQVACVPANWFDRSRYRR